MKNLDFIKTPITNIKQAKTFYRTLLNNGFLFHPEDSPDSIVNKNGECIFDKNQSDYLKQRVKESYDFFEDPCKYCLLIMRKDSKLSIS